MEMETETSDSCFSHLVDGKSRSHFDFKKYYRIDDMSESSLIRLRSIADEQKSIRLGSDLLLRYEHLTARNRPLTKI